MIDLDKLGLMVGSGFGGHLLTTNGMATTDHFVGAVIGLFIIGLVKMSHDFAWSVRSTTGGEQIDE